MTNRLALNQKEKIDGSRVCNIQFFVMAMTKSILLLLKRRLYQSREKSRVSYHINIIIQEISLLFEKKCNLKLIMFFGEKRLRSPRLFY